MLSELMILHGTGGSKMARTYPYYDGRTGTYKMRRRKRRRSSVGGSLGSLGNLGAFGTSSSLKGMFGSVKGVLITGSIAAGGAIITDRLYDKFATSLNLDGWKRDVAKIATGIALGILIAKLTKKPKLAAAFAIGPVVAGAIRLFSGAMGETAGLGYVSYSPINAYESMYAPLYGADESLGLTTYKEAAGPQTSFVPPLPVSAVVGAGL